MTKHEPLNPMVDQALLCVFVVWNEVVKLLGDRFVNRRSVVRFHSPAPFEAVEDMALVRTEQEPFFFQK